MVLFPRMLTPLYVGRDRSLRAVEAALNGDQRLVAVAQSNEDADTPEPQDLYSVGAETTVSRLMHMPDGTANILAQAGQRVRILEFTQLDPYLIARVRVLAEPVDNSLPTEALMRAVLALFEKCANLSRNIPDDAYIAAMNAKDAGALADLIASTLELEMKPRQELLETLDPAVRLQKINVILAKELEVLELESRIHSKVQEEMDKNQREYYLREQMKAIQGELGEMDPVTQEINALKEKVLAAKMTTEATEKALQELERMGAMPPAMPEGTVIRTYIDWLLALPWEKATTDNLDVQRAAKVLEEHHYGLPKAKERILEYIAIRKLAGSKMRSPVLCFVGPPGTGKTSLGKSIAEALGRQFVRVSLGGIRDEAEIRGHRRTYVGALPGRIIQTMRRAGTVNPVFMLDEIDKIGTDFRGDPSSALLEVLDPEQNNAFSDHYLEVPYDLSKVMFITTANILDPVPPALHDRLEVIEFPGYIEEEKIEIARRFIIPRQLEGTGLKELHFSEKALQKIIREYTLEAGVRNLEREVSNICRKVARRVAEEKRASKIVSESHVEEFLGPPLMIDNYAQGENQVGVATGMAYTEGGGDVMPIEVAVLDGKGNLILTGQLGDVMQESAEAALSYTRSRIAELIPDEEVDFDKRDIHIHVPEGGIPKDGPSAGITLATAVISALTGYPVRRDVAMTGEITLRGRVLPVGGFREKVLAAYRVGIKTVIAPEKNKRDLSEIPKKVQRRVNFIWVKMMDEVLNTALVFDPACRQRPPRPRGAESVEQEIIAAEEAAPVPA
jgi:ATP-dependent Lon protease